jgi:ferritin
MILKKAKEASSSEYQVPEEYMTDGKEKSYEEEDSKKKGSEKSRDDILKEAAEDPKNKEIDKTRRECTLSDDIQELLLRQLKHELQNHNVYMSFANFFDVRGLVVLGEYYEHRAHEEMLHHDWIRKYLNDNDASYMYPDIEQYDLDDIDSLEKPFDITVDLEIETTQLINEIVDQAANEGDWATFNWLLGHSKDKGRLVEEQVEEESISRSAREIANSDADWLKKEQSIMALYKKGEE